MHLIFELFLQTESVFNPLFSLLQVKMPPVVMFVTREQLVVEALVQLLQLSSDEFITILNLMLEMNSLSASAVDAQREP
jgi:hypothetical protein